MNAIEYFARGLYEFECKNYLEAIKAYQEAIKFRPVFLEALYCALGYAFLKLGKINEAVSNFEIAIELKPDFAIPYAGIGECMRLNGDYEKAEKYVSKPIEIDSKYATAFYCMARILLDQNDVENGLKFFYRSLILAKPSQVLEQFWGNLKICMDHELGLVAYEYLFNKTDDLKESFHVNPNILEADRITKPFRQQFKLWETYKVNRENLLLLEALLNFYMGNPIRSYEIFDTEMVESEERPLPVIAQYYFARSASQMYQNRFSHYHLVPAFSQLCHIF